MARGGGGKWRGEPGASGEGSPGQTARGARGKWRGEPGANGERNPGQTASGGRGNRRAGARGQGVGLEQVHLHEVGAVDAWIDVGGANLALERLGVERVFSSAPLVGAGSVVCAHGELPVPAPAVAGLLSGREMRRPSPAASDGERTTPTGAALLTHWTTDFELPERFWNQRTGVGAGTRDSEQGIANLLRVELGSLSAPGSATEPARREAWCMEVNIDDLSPEEVGHALGQIREAGALEVWSVAAHFKKHRPGAVLSALARPDRQSTRLNSSPFTITYAVVCL
mgnify:CR=1 FL=1